MYTLLAGYPPFRGDTDREILENVLNEELVFPDQGWSNKSMAAKELIGSLLQKDRNKRISLKDALDHRWFRG